MAVDREDRETKPDNDVDRSIDTQSAEAVLIGQTLGGYKILRLLGQGGMATVYVAHQGSIQRDVAIKVIRQNLRHKDPTFYTRFEREARMTASLEHVHILPVIDFGQAEDHLYLVTRLLNGSLADYIVENHPLPLEEISRLLDQIGEALDYAHRQGVIHRDLKPANVLLDNQRNAFLGDFGIAHLMGTGNTLTGEGRIVGTPTYMSPEQIMGSPASAASDIYSLGAMLFEMLSGRVPFIGDTAFIVMNMHLTASLPIISTFRDDLPEAVEAVIRKAMAKLPGERFESGRALAEAFAGAIHGKMFATNSTAAYLPGDKISPTTPATLQPIVLASENAVTYVDALPVSVTPPAPSPVRDKAMTAQPTKNRRVALLFIPILLIALAIGGGVWFTHRTDPAQAKVLNDAGVAALSKLDYTTAVNDFKQAITLDPDNAAAYFNLGVAYEEQDDTSQALVNYQAALDRNSQLLLARYRLAELLLDTKDIEGGFQVVDTGIRILRQGSDLGLDQDTLKALTFNLYTTRGRAYLLRGTAKDLALAVNDLQQALANKDSVPYAAPAYYYLAKVYEAQGDKTQAQQAWQDTLANYDTDSARQRDWADEARKAIPGS
ncbi:MAG: protein kinase [Chloroflexota bacterium]